MFEVFELEVKNYLVISCCFRDHLWKFMSTKSILPILILCHMFRFWKERLCNYTSSRPEVFLWKGVLKISSRFTEEQPCGSVISVRLRSIFIEITLRHGCSPVNLLHIFRTPFFGTTSGWLLLQLGTKKFCLLYISFLSYINHLVLLLEHFEQSLPIVTLNFKDTKCSFFPRKFYIGRNKSKVNFTEIWHAAAAHLFPLSDQDD